MQQIVPLSLTTKVNSCPRELIITYTKSHRYTIHLAVHCTTNRLAVSVSPFTVGLCGIPLLNSVGVTHKINMNTNPRTGLLKASLRLEIVPSFVWVRSPKSLAV